MQSNMDKTGYSAVRYEQQQTPSQTTEIKTEVTQRRNSTEPARTSTPTNQYGYSQQPSAFGQPLSGSGSNTVLSPHLLAQQNNQQSQFPGQQGGMGGLQGGMGGQSGGMGQPLQPGMGQSFQSVAGQHSGSGQPHGYTHSSPTVGTHSLTMPYNKLMNIGGSVIKTIAKFLHNQPSWTPVPLQSTALITGASTGIGKELAKTLASSSINLVIVADDNRLADAVDELRALNPLIRIDTIICDLSSPNGPQELFNEVKRLGLTIDILVNNAAVARFGKFLDTSPDALYRMMVLDIIGATKLCHLFGKEMLSRGHGRIVNMSSLNAFAPSPNLAVYAACGAFLYNFSKALSFELRGTGVSVMCVCPGPTKQTEFQSRAGAGGPDQTPRGWKGMFPMITPQQVATETMFGLLLNRETVVPGFSHRLKALAYQFLPTCVLLPIESYLNTI